MRMRNALVLTSAGHCCNPFFSNLHFCFFFSFCFMFLFYVMAVDSKIAGTFLLIANIFALNQFSLSVFCSALLKPMQPFFVDKKVKNVYE